ncbi:hypothetical protein FHS96_000308 [Sphingomonas zeicaulis]|uniref:hypothetical protein n=1 Tax=Sphingomonas zeicaulis TaxID=1632740 RepID=UPI003D222536
MGAIVMAADAEDVTTQTAVLSPYAPSSMAPHKGRFEDFQPIRFRRSIERNDNEASLTGRRDDASKQHGNADEQDLQQQIDVDDAFEVEARTRRGIGRAQGVWI